MLLSVLCLCLSSWAALGIPRAPAWLVLQAQPTVPAGTAPQQPLPWHCSPLCLLGWHCNLQSSQHCTLYPCLATQSPLPSRLCAQEPTDPPALHLIALCPGGCTPNSRCCTPKSCSCPSNICPCTLQRCHAAASHPCSPVPHPACSHGGPEAAPALGHPRSSSRVKRGCAGPGRASPGREGSLGAGGARRGAGMRVGERPGK